MQRGFRLPALPAVLAPFTAPMRIIAGTCKGRKLVAPNTSHVRPALDQVKEAVFNILFDVTDQTVLDLFAGSGSMGLEALSRGARHATFVERNAAATAAMRSNISACGMDDRAVIMKTTVAGALERLHRHGACFDLIFVDPPYLTNAVNPTLERLAAGSFMTPNTLVVIEHHPKEPIAEIAGMILTDTRKYGQTLISFMKTAER